MDNSEIARILRVLEGKFQALSLEVNSKLGVGGLESVGGSGDTSGEKVNSGEPVSEPPVLAGGESEGVGSDVGGVGVESGLGSVSSGSSSWADAVEEEEEVRKLVDKKEKVWSGSLEKVKMPPGGPSTLSLGGLSFVAGEGVASNFYSDYVRVEAVKGLVAWMASRGVRVTKAYREELALSRYAAACVPDAFDRGRERLKALAKVGDNVLTLALSDQLYFEKRSAADIQGVCGKLVSHMSLSGVCVATGLHRYMVFPSGVDLRASKPAGEAVEAMAAVVFHSGGMEGVVSFMRALQLLK